MRLWIAIAAIPLQVSCKKTTPFDPQHEFQRIRTAIVHDDLLRAQHEAEAASRRYPGQNSEWYWKFRLLEAEALTLQGQNKEVLTLLSSDLPAPLAQGNLAVLRDMDRGLAYARLGNFPAADHNLHEAVQICDSYCDAFGELARTEGAVETVRNDVDAAEACFRRSLQVAHQRGDSFLELTDLLNLGVVAIGKEHFDQSIDWSTNAQQVSQRLGAGLAEEKTLGNLGWAYYKVGDFEKSLDYFKAANEKAVALRVPIDQVEWLNDVGLVYLSLHQLPLADSYYRQSLALAEKSQNQNQIVAALTAQAFVSVERGDLQAAEQSADRALDLAMKAQNLESKEPILLVQGRIAARSHNFAQAKKLFSDVIQNSNGDLSLRWEAQNDLAKLDEQQGNGKLADSDYRSALSTVESARSSLQREESRLPFLANADHLYDDYIHFLVTQHRSAEALQVADYSRALTLAEGLGLSRKNSAQMRTESNPQALARGLNATILFYALGREQSYLWVMDPRGVRLIQLPASFEIDAAVQAYRKVLIGPRDAIETENPDGTKLYDMLLKPAEPELQQSSRVVIVPDGSLNNLNFETLIVPGQHPHYWIEDVTLENAASLRLLAARHKHSATETNLLLIGDAVVPDPAYNELPKAAMEMSEVAKHFNTGQREVFDRTHATATAYLDSHPETFSYIHFVAHGTASRLSPLDSAVILSPASAEPDSFKLYARDIIRQPLRAELVTISSCNGSGVRAYSGEGLVGLSWAFLRAGAHNVIGALWEVNDASTPALMDQLYTEIAKGSNPEDALRTAKLSLLHSNGPFRKPLYWAPFQLYTGS